jgi:hypothetical protein
MTVIGAEKDDLPIVSKGAILSLHTTETRQHEGRAADMFSSTMRTARIVDEK